MVRILNVVLAFILFASCAQTETIGEPEKITWNDFMVKATSLTHQFVRYIEPNIKNYFVSGNISESCVKSVQLYLEGLKEWRPWAIKMADSTGRIPTGLLTATMMDYGSYDQCLKIRANVKDDAESFKGKYCMAVFKSPLIQSFNLLTDEKTYEKNYGVPPDWIRDVLVNNKLIAYNFAAVCIGMCLPSTCTKEDLHNFLSTATKPWISEVSLLNCQDDEPRPWPTSAIFAIFLLSLLLALCVLGTVLDLKDHRLLLLKKTDETINEGFFKKLLKTFSVPSNSAKVFEKRTKAGPFDSLDGIRFFLSLWVISSHVFAYPVHMKEQRYTSTTNLLEMMGFSTMFVENAYVNMENFCVISGFLLVYTTKKTLDKNGGMINLFEFFTKKWFRMMPSFFAVVIAFYAMPVMGKGPLWDSTWEVELDHCQKTWWTNLIFIQNFNHINDLCMPHSWFVANIMQMQIVAIFLLLVTYRFPKIGVAISSLTTFLCVGIVYSTSMYHKFLMVDFNTVPSTDMILDFGSYIYVRPFNHFPSFLVGMVLGWVMLNHKDVKLSMRFRAVCWYATITFYAIGLYGILLPTRNHAIISAYYALRTIGWALSTSWLLFSLFTGKAGFLNKFFEIEAFVPVGRISYSIYVFHPLIILYRAATRRERLYLSIEDMAFEFVAYVAISIALAYIGYITVELPFSNMYDLLYKEFTSLTTPNESKYTLTSNKNKAGLQNRPSSYGTKAKKY